MKQNDTKKITALGVVIFSFFGIVICMAILLLFDFIFALLVAKTTIPEGFLKVANVVASAIALIASTAFITAKGRVKGIVSAGVISAGIILIKIIGNAAMDMGGYLDLNGLVGAVLTVIFSIVGGVLGSMLKQ